MNSIDITVIIICFLSILIGFVRGGLASILSTAGWILAIVGNHFLFESIEPFLEAKFHSKLITFIVGYVGDFFLLLFALSILNFLILSAVSTFKGGVIDKTIGVIFGGIRGILLIVVIFICFDTGFKTLAGENVSSNLFPDVLLQAKTLPLLRKGELVVLQYAPKAFTTHIKSNDDNLNEITMLNLIRKLSSNLTSTELLQIKKHEKSQYISKKQALKEKIQTLWYYYEKNKDQQEKLSKEDIQTIQLILS